MLATVGVYSVMANAIAERTHEIGLRMALGADRRAVLSMVLRRSAPLTAAGVALGLAAALALTRSLQSFLYQVQPTDPATLAAGAALLAFVALLACLIPARRAMRVDPAVALRQE
jgi:putative ABC transport system permease protein